MVYLVHLRRDIFDGLKAYYGTLAKTHSYTTAAKSRGESLFGIDDLFEPVVVRIDALISEIITRRQPSVSSLPSWRLNRDAAQHHE